MNLNLNPRKWFKSNRCPELKYEGTKFYSITGNKVVEHKTWDDALNGKPDVSKKTLRTIVVGMLEAQGSITNRDLVRITNGQTWLTSDLRREGYIKPFAADTWETGASGKRYKRYYWTGKRAAEKALDKLTKA